MIEVSEREALMVQLYGECCKRVTAMKILSVSSKTLNGMLTDGRVDTACDGAMVDVRSMARYIARRPQADYEARLERTKKRNHSNWAI